MKSNLDKSFVEFVIDQINDNGNIAYKYMFGGCAIYCDNKVVAIICGSSLYVRPTEGGRKYIGDVCEEAPYPGAKLQYLITDKIDDKEWLYKLIKVTAEELSEPKAK